MTYPQPGYDATRPQPVSGVPGPYPPVSGVPRPYPPVSALALRETRDGTRSGHGMAIAGLVLGYVFVAPMIAFTFMVFFGSVVGAATPTPTP